MMILTLFYFYMFILLLRFLDIRITKNVVLTLFFLLLVIFALIEPSQANRINKLGLSDYLLNSFTSAV